MSKQRDATILALGLVAGATGVILYQGLSDEDRNPIRVKNKILHFETEGKNSKWDPDGGTANKWRLKGNKHGSGQYEVNAYGSTECLTPVSGETVDILFDIPTSGGSVETRKFTAALEPVGNGSEPVLQAEEAMAADNSSDAKKLRFARSPEPNGSIREVTIHTGQNTKTCRFPSDRRVLVELCRGSCS